MKISLGTIEEICNATTTSNIPKNRVIEELIIDSRKIIKASEGTLFVALKGPRHNGHQFIVELYKKGVRNFIISEDVPETSLDQALFLRVGNGLDALQSIASHHRAQLKTKKDESLIGYFFFLQSPHLS